MHDPKSSNDEHSGGYRPDPEAETAMTISAFFDALVEELPGERGLSDRLARRHEALVADQQHRLVDEASRHNLSLTLAVVAAYRELRARHDEDELVPLLTRAFVAPLHEVVRAATRAALDSAADPFTSMVHIAKERERLAFGIGFDFGHPEDDGDRYTVEVNRCYYHDVLTANGAGQLTTVFCAFDANWIDAIDPGHDGFAFERPTTIGTGGASCPFRFRRTS